MPKVPKTLLDKIIVDKALDRASRLRNQMLERGMTVSEVKGLEEELVEALNPIVNGWRPAMVRGSVGAKDILTTGRFKNQFETGRSGGVYDLKKRRRLSNRYFGEVEDDTAREKYGYLKRPMEYGWDDVGSYGDYDFQFKPTVRNMMTLNNGDSLNDSGTSHGPTPLIPGYEDTYINFVGRPTNREGISREHWPSEIKLYKKRLEELKKSPGPSSVRDNYLETQYHGPLTLGDVDGMRVWYRKHTDIPRSMWGLIGEASDRYDFPVYDWEGKCIYNCR